MTLKEKIEELKKEAALIHQHIGGVERLEVRIKSPTAEMMEMGEDNTVCIQHPNASYYILTLHYSSIDIVVESQEKYRTILEPINATEQSH